MFKTTLKKILPLFLLLLCAPILTHAAPLMNPLSVGGKDPNINEVIGRIIKFLLGLSGSVALLMFVWGGFQYLWSAGDTKKVEKGKETLKNAMLGIFIILFAYVAINALIIALTTGKVA